MLFEKKRDKAPINSEKMVKNKDSYHHGTLFSRMYKILFYILSPRKNIGCFRLCGDVKNKLLTNQQ